MPDLLHPRARASPGSRTVNGKERWHTSLSGFNPTRSTLQTIAKPAPAEEDATALWRRLQRSLEAETVGGIYADVYDEAAAALEALREAKLGTDGRKDGGRAGRGASFWCRTVLVPDAPIWSRIMSDPVMVASGAPGRYKNASGRICS